MARRGEAATLAADVWQQLRQEVLDGTLAPGQRLMPNDIAVRLGVSKGVVREALTRLIEQRLVDSQHNQGFQVITLSPKRLRDLTAFRITSEELALTLAIERGDLQWESDVVGAHHRMVTTPRRTDENPDVTTEAWSQAHRDFHVTLIRACDYTDLFDLCARLYDSAEIYRRWSAPASRGTRDVDAEHTRLLEATLKRDSERACRELRDHYERTAAIVLASATLRPEDLAR